MANSKMDEIFDNIKTYWETDEGKASLEKFKQEEEYRALRIEEIKKITNIRLDRFHTYLKDNNISFENVYLHIREKYSSKEYKKRFPNYDEPCSLYSFLYDYGIRYGRIICKEEYDFYDNVFCGGDMYYIDGYYLSNSYGQGESHINFDKEDKTKDFSNFIILDKIAKYLEENNEHNLRFGQVLHNLNINEFADKNDPSKKDYLLRDIHNDDSKKILKRMIKRES